LEVAENEPFVEKYFYKLWVKACKNLGSSILKTYKIETEKRRIRARNAVKGHNLNR
jgi:hypothetical protein